MFVLMENNLQLHLGPMHWHQPMFQRYINDELQLPATLPFRKEDNLPIEITPNLHIFPATEVYPVSQNSKIEQYAGPYWDITNNFATGTYINVPKPVTQVQNELKAILANNRWVYETQGITLTVQGHDVFIITARGERDIFLQSLQLMSPGDLRPWKFDNIWLTLTYADMQFIVGSIVAHIQNAFAWEQARIAEIDAVDVNSVNALTELDLIQLTV